MLGEVNIDNYSWLGRSWLLKEKLLLPLSQTNLISSCFLNTILIAAGQGSLSAFIKEVSFLEQIETMY